MEERGDKFHYTFDNEQGDVGIIYSDNTFDCNLSCTFDIDNE